MARFYGTIQGARGPASRLGHKSSGLCVTAQSYQGDIVVNLSALDVADETDWVTIHACDHPGGSGVLLYGGPIKHLVDQKGHDFLVQQMAYRAMEKENKSASE